MSCQAGPGFEHSTSALKASAPNIELTWQIKFRVEGRRPVGRPRRTWLESVDMAELEIDKEDVHDRKKNGERML